MRSTSNPRLLLTHEKYFCKDSHHYCPLFPVSSVPAGVFISGTCPEWLQGPRLCEPPSEHPVWSLHVLLWGPGWEEDIIWTSFDQLVCGKQSMRAKLQVQRQEARRFPQSIYFLPKVTAAALDKVQQDIWGHLLHAYPQMSLLRSTALVKFFSKTSIYN